ncbi:hypothetical protein C8J55DRAFT_500293 [Lentinula edodes]|uniref:Uncharacterized protein n=1 Tax=Lentinula lateritia TaxID=40482 RepID=A0A9W9E0D8_9AGAR|nr:hypothetical protein C8J55DRAFT_500293 [Lentinula edodes]
MLLRFALFPLRKFSMCLLLATVFFSGLATVVTAMPSLSRRTDGVVEPASKWTLKVAITNASYYKKIKKVKASSHDIAILIVGPDRTFAATTPGYDPATTPGTFIQPPVDDIPKATRGTPRLNGEYYMLLEVETKFSFTGVKLDEEAIFNTLRDSSKLNVAVGPPVDKDNLDLDYIDRALELLKKVGGLKGDVAKWPGVRQKIMSDRDQAKANAKKRQV